LRDKEVVLTFDDGPWPGNTPAVLKALTDECLKATFFEIGEHATSSRDYQAGDCGRHDDWHAYLVA
jgi:peptidoglycan/xylan/chitin deacetylase (PgdA/CDA1 family)